MTNPVVTQMRHFIDGHRTEIVAVETYAGTTAYGPSLAASVDVTCHVMRTRRLVRNADGVEVVSEVTLHAAAADEAKFTPESRLTIGTQVSTVLAVSPKTLRGEVVYVEVAGS